MILNLRLLVSDLSAADLEALGQAINIEKRRRQLPRNATAESPPRVEAAIDVRPMPPAVIPMVQTLSSVDHSDPWLTSSIGSEQ